MYIFFSIVVSQEIGYLTYRRLLDMNIAVRVMGITLEVIFYGLAVVAFVYALLYC